MKENYTGFETLSVDSLPEYRSTGIQLRHYGTGAQIYKIYADDSENLISYIFRTPPANNSGVAHILEHSVLCGSKRYPLKDPFLVLLKGSAHTFLNAITYPDKTVYPAASTIKADYINLLRVYGDAVFFPQLRPEVFAQEGHRLEYDEEGRLRRAGIVLNEMKGAYSSVESVVEDYTLRLLFPDSPYGWDSGGNPSHIPSLVYEGLKAFHQTYYHPSNVRVFLYGDADLGECLQILDGEFFSHFERREIDSQIGLQQRWQSPRRAQVAWPCDDSTAKRSTISISWLFGGENDLQAALSGQALSFILLGHGGAPLQKAIIDSGLGEDLSPVSGLDTNLRQLAFSVGLRGTDPSKCDDFERLVMGTLEKLVKEKLDSKLVEGAMRLVEFRMREIRGGSPFGLRLMKQALRAWLHDRAPMESLALEGPMEALRGRVQKGYFEEIISRELIRNTHRSTLTIVPSSGFGARRLARERGELDRLQKQELDARALQRSLKRLRTFQSTPDSRRALKRIPFLKRSQLPREVLNLPLEKIDQSECYMHTTFTNKVSYLVLAFDLASLDARLQPWLPLFCRALTEVGLPGVPHQDVAVELSLKTGGMSCSLDVSSIHPNVGGGLKRHLFVRLKALNHQWREALEIAQRLLVSADFSDSSRLSDLLSELKNDYRAALVPSGHDFSSNRAAAKHSIAASWEDLWYGIEQILFLGHVKTAEASSALSEIRRHLIKQGNLSAVFTSDEDFAARGLSDTLGMIGAFPAGSPAPPAVEPELFRHEALGETIAIASSVTFSSLSLPAPLFGSPEHARLGLLAHILKTGYLWESIRMRGGAYGAFVSLAVLEGTFTFSTYRDPVILPSLKSFRDSLEWTTSKLKNRTVDMAVIGSIGRELQPFGPGERGLVAFKRRLYGITDEIRQKRRNVQIEASAEDLKQEAEALLAKWDKRSITVIGGANLLSIAALSPELAQSRVELPF